MGKLKYVMIMCLILLSFTGCSGQSKDDATIKKSGDFADGTYTETAKGKKGKFDVTVVIKDGRIAEVTIGDNSETPDKGGAAINQLPQNIVDEQTYDVDAVSGATITSDGIKNAVKKCLQEASK